MTAQLSEKPVARRPETGWSRARRLRGAATPRTCLPAVQDEVAAARPAPAGPEENIFRGED